MGTGAVPQDSLAKTTLPSDLEAAIQAIFSANGTGGCSLVGGTALAGYYAAHRRSDDIDLFTEDEVSQAMTVHAVKALTKIGASLTDQRQAPSYYHTTASMKRHRFTIDVVLDPNLFRVGAFIPTKSGVRVADLDTLHKMKIATLLSRCSEKDLFDLAWLNENFRELPIAEFVALGREIDAGVTAETLLVSLCGAKLREAACTFSIDPELSPTHVLEIINAYKSKLQGLLIDYLEDKPVDIAIAPLIRKLKKWL